MAEGKRPKQFFAPFAGLKKKAAAERSKEGTGAAALRSAKAGHGTTAEAKTKTGERRAGSRTGTATGTHDPRRTATAAAATSSPADDALFAAAMRDAVPLGIAPRRMAPAAPRPVSVRPSDDDYALAELCAIVDGASDFRTHTSEEEFFGAAAGVNNALLDGLRRGQYAYQHCLDLHGLVRHDAHQQVIRFITQARCRDGATCVLIVTGRGKSSPDGTSVLRETLPRWLSRAPVRPHVLAYATARPVDGGPGAYYVLLRRAGVPPFGQAP